jgi:hypothetical protein
LNVDENRITNVLHLLDNDPSQVASELTLWPANQAKRSRDVLAIKGDWKILQRKLYRTLFLPRFAKSSYSHGAVRKRSAATNARAHIGNEFLLKIDVADFFPSISSHRVYRFFLKNECSPSAAHILTRLCTYHYHLALGLVTSPIIANAIFGPIDARIAALCQAKGLTYTRFIDDITISGPFRFDDSGFANSIGKILRSDGFRLAKNKTETGRFSEGATVTGVRVKRDHLDASKGFMVELNRLIDDHDSLSRNGEFTGPLLTDCELFGKTEHACRLNPGRRRALWARLGKIEWHSVMRFAAERDLARVRNRFTKRGAPQPNQLETLLPADKWKELRDSIDFSQIDPMECPFDDSEITVAPSVSAA